MDASGRLHNPTQSAAGDFDSPLPRSQGMNNIHPEDQNVYARQLRTLAAKNISSPFNSSSSSSPPSQFITHKQLLKLWTIPEIRRVLRRHVECKDIRADSIQDGYLRVFSMLVWCDKVADLSSFTSQAIGDNQFPRRQMPETFAAHDHLKALFRDILDLQWTFFPLLIHSIRLGVTDEPPERILPILHEEKIAQGEEAAVFKTLLHSDCCDNALSTRKDGKVVAVRKVYSTKFAHRSMYNRESNAYQALQNCRCEHIVGYYGSFIHLQFDGTEIPSLLLEHVEGLNLEEFFEQANRPQNKQELLNLWGGFEGLFEALHHIYNHKVTIVHQDISPFNLMVSGKPDLSKKLHFKVTDFGYSYTATQGVRGGHPLDMMGGRKYGAPQSCHDDPFLDQGPNVISPAVDVWSAGAIMSDTAAWIYGGQRERDEYDMRRLEEVKERPILEHFPYFHNGVVRLGTVDRFHRKFTKKLPDYDVEITKPILTIVELYMIPAMDVQVMMQQPSKIKATLNKMLESAANNVGLSESQKVSEQTTEEIMAIHDLSLAEGTPIEITQTGSETYLPPRHSNLQGPPAEPWQLPPPPPEPRPQLSWLDACEYYHRKKRNLPIDEETATVVETLVSKLRGRDFIFLVDTSISMKPHQESMEEFLLIYSYLVKGMDADGVIDVCYTASGESKSSKKSSAILSDFRKQKWTGLGFEDKLSDLISQMSNRIRDRKGDDRSIISFRSHQKLTKQSIFVLTDGSWRGLDGIKDHIRRIIQTIKDAGLGRTQFTIQFISFGPDLAGLQRLKELDNFGRDERLGMDIVDTKPFDYDVCAVLFGAIDEAADDDDEIPGSSGMTSPS